MIKRFAIFLTLILFLSSSAFALEWKRLHEEADSKSLKGALISSQENPGSLEDLYVLAMLYLNLHKNSDAESVFKAMLTLEPGLTEARWGIAEVLRRRGENQKAEELLQGIMKESPGFSPANITLAYLRYRQTRFQEAIRLALAVLRQGQDEVDLSNYTRAYLIIGGARGMLASAGGVFSKIVNGTQVLPNLKKAEELQPDSPAVLFGLGSFYFLAPAIAGGNRQKALEYLERAIEVDPLFADAYVRLAQVYKMQGDEITFRKYLDRALEIEPDNELVKDALSGSCKFNCVTVDVEGQN
ncbi:tetratricopeptide repeat protein [Candidatus Omnitrophota bacterium]